MRSALAPPLIALALLVPLARATDAPAPAETPPAFTTEVKGTVPDLVGRWLVVAQVWLPKGEQPVTNVASLWEVTAPGGKPALTIRYVGLPQGIKDALDATKREHRAWEPSIENLQALRDDWTTLAPEDPGIATVETTITGRDAFSDVIASDEKMKDAQFLVQISTAFTPGGERAIKEVLRYGAKEQDSLGWRGAYASVRIAAAPFPIPFVFGGDFRMYRLESVPPRGLVERILGVFRGCGRKGSS